MLNTLFVVHELLSGERDSMHAERKNKGKEQKNDTNAHVDWIGQSPITNL